MTILAIGLLDKFIDCYNWEATPPKMQFEKLEENLEAFGERYSYKLLNSIKKMVAIDPTKRPDPITYLNILENKLSITKLTPERVNHPSPECHLKKSSKQPQQQQQQ